MCGIVVMRLLVARIVICVVLIFVVWCNVVIFSAGMEGMLSLSAKGIISARV